MIFKCDFCDWTSLDEDPVVYCCGCGASTCGEKPCMTFKEHQGFQESICKDCKKQPYSKPKWAVR
jgi:hypothetical protein